MLELPGPEGQNLNKRTPRHFILVECTDISLQVADQHHCIARSRLSLLNFSITYMRPLPWFTHGILKYSVGKQAVNTACPNTLPRHCCGIEEGKAETWLHARHSTWRVKDPVTESAGWKIECVLNEIDLGSDNVDSGSNLW